MIFGLESESGPGSKNVKIDLNVSNTPRSDLDPSIYFPLMGGGYYDTRLG